MGAAKQGKLFCRFRGYSFSFRAYRDQRVATPNGAFCKAFFVVIRILGQIQRWAFVVEKQLKWRKDVFWLRVSVLVSVLTLVVGAWGERGY